MFTRFTQLPTKKKIVNGVVALIIVLCIVAAIVTPIVFCFKQGEKSDTIWSETDTFNPDYAMATLKKEKDKDFVIVNFTDLQIDLPSDWAKTGEIYKTVKAVIEQSNPDLITFSGDNAWFPVTVQCYKRFAKVMDGFKIPWAITFGNHDHQGNADLNKLGEIIQDSKYGLFDKGPRNINGVGNSFINIVEDYDGVEKIVHTVFLMDSGDSGNHYTEEQKATTIDYNPIRAEEIPVIKTYAQSLKDAYFKDCLMDFDEYPFVEELEEQGTDYLTVGTSYSAIAESQIDWYEWVLKGNEEINRQKGFVTDTMPESTCVFHIPFYEYYLAYKSWLRAIETNDTATLTSLDVVGRMRCSECGGISGYNTGFFAKMKELGSTKNVIVGHDHVNDFSIVYQGIRLTYGVKTGKECYWTDDGSMNGGTRITLGTGGRYTKLEQVYYDKYRK